MRISGNAILITGGTSGIGAGFAEKFLLEGNKVIICGRRVERLKEMKEKYPSLIVKECDISITNQREEFCAWVLQNHPDINILINNAGVQLATDLTHAINLDKVRTEVESNFIAPVHLSSLFAQHLASKEEAAIINISSGLAFAPLAFMAIYCATKAALHSFTLSLRRQLKNTTVKVFEIAPPSVDTELGHERRQDKSQTHGGITVAEFIQEAMEGLKKDEFEVTVGQAKNLKAKREELFEAMNSRQETVGNRE